MSRHGRKVPTNFYAQFTRDARVFAEKHAKGRIVSVLEGGYSDRALISGTFAHFCALGLSEEHTWNETWWNKDNLDALQNATKTKKPRGHVSGPLSAPKADPEPEPWLKQAVSIFQHLEPIPFKTPRKGKAILVEPSSRTLRQRKVGSSSPASPKSKPEKSEATGKDMPRGKINSSLSKGQGKKTEPVVITESTRSDGQAEDSDSSTESFSTLSSMSNSDAGLPISAPSKKLPRVILKLGPPPNP